MSSIKVNSDGSIDVVATSKMTVSTSTSIPTTEPTQTSVSETTDIQNTENTSVPIPDDDGEKKLRFIADWGFLACAAIFSIIFFGGGLYYLFVMKQPWLVDIIQKQFAALVIPPMTMVSAMIVVISLKVMSGPMKFKILGFEFEGSSAPIIMWILVYLVMIHSVTLLWIDPSITQNITTLIK